jgi:hypothetical protein
MIASLTSACSSQADRTEAIEISRAYLEDRFAGGFLANRFAARENDDSWTVEYSPPDGWVGGRMIVVVDKSSRAVIGFRGEQ